VLVAFLIILLFSGISPGWAQEPGPRSGAVVWFKGLAVNVFWVQEVHKGLYSGSNKIGDPRTFRQHRFPIQVGYSPYPDLQLFASWPYKLNTLNYHDGSGRPTERTAGVGDLLLLARYRVYRRDIQSGTNQISISFGPEIPIGSAQLKDGNGTFYSPSLQPGSGSWNWLASVSGAFPRGRVEKGASLVAKWFGENDDGIRRSPWVEFHGGWHYRIVQKKYPGPQFAIGGGLNYISFGSAYQNGDRLRNSGGQRLSLVLPDGHWVPFVWLMLHYELDWPIWQNVNGEQLGEKGPLVVFWVHFQHAF